MNEQRTVVLSMLTAGIIFGTAMYLRSAVDSSGKPAVGDNLPHEVNITTVGAWGIVFTTLIILADIESTSALSASFAMLFLLAIMFTYGLAAAANLQALTKSEA